MSLEIFDIDTKQKINKQIKELGWSSEQVTKCGCEHYMLKEILEQPNAVRQALMQDRNLITETSLDILKTKNVIITACGTSRYAALIGRYLFSKLGGKFCDVVMASEFQYFADSVDRNTMVIAVSQSGETADVIQGVKIAKEQGAKIFSVVNTVECSLARLSDKVIYLNCGPEIGVAATKTFINQLVIFYLLSFAMNNKLEESFEKIKKISYVIENIIQNNGNKLKQIADKTKSQNDFYYIARGIDFAIASEGALKLKELSYIHAEGMPAGELKHGTLSLIEQGTPVVAICPKDYTYEETLSNVHEAKSRGGFIIGVSDKYNEIFDEWIEIPKVEEIFYPLVSIIPLQLLAYYLAVARGKNPDKPRNLAKSVTVK